jgi:hypothetical protein
MNSLGGHVSNPLGLPKSVYEYRRIGFFDVGPRTLIPFSLLGLINFLCFVVVFRQEMGTQLVLDKL